MNKKLLLFLIVIMSVVVLSSCAMAYEESTLSSIEDNVVDFSNTSVQFDWELSDNSLKKEIELFLLNKWGLHYIDESLIEKNLSDGEIIDLFYSFSPSSATFDASLDVESEDYPWSEKYYSTTDQTKLYAKKFSLSASCEM